jgi:hypothetical protein
MEPGPVADEAPDVQRHPGEMALPVVAGQDAAGEGGHPLAPGWHGEAVTAPEGLIISSGQGTKLARRYSDLCPM